MTHKKKKSGNSMVGSSPGVWAGVEKDYRAEDDMRTLARAGEIKGDKERLRAALDCNKKTQKSLEKVCK